MRSSLMFITLLATCCAAACQTTQPRTATDAQRVSSGRTAEAGCASCIFHMEGVTGCELAVKIDGQPYLVTGSDIDDHGDAHASDGLCNAASNAVVEGRIDGDRFIATRFELRP